jgi:hypothetical protein
VWAAAAVGEALSVLISLREMIFLSLVVRMVLPIVTPRVIGAPAILTRSVWAALQLLSRSERTTFEGVRFLEGNVVANSGD